MGTDTDAKTLKLLRQLNKLGEANAIADEELAEAVHAMAEYAVGILPEGESLPRGYSVVRLTSSQRSQAGKLFLANSNGELLNAEGGHLHGDFGTPTPRPSRAAMEQFADDIVSLWLEDVLTYLRAREALTSARAAELQHKVAEEVKP